jgi:hypothetical protein
MPWAIAASFFFVLAFLGQEKIGSASTLSGFPPEDCPPQSPNNAAKLNNVGNS